MAIKKIFVRFLLPALFVIALGGTLYRYAVSHNVPVLHDVVTDSVFGKIAVFRPLFSDRGLTVVYVDTKKFPADTLGYNIARMGTAVAVVDTGQAIHGLSNGANGCIDVAGIAEPAKILSGWAHPAKSARSVLAGIGDGALLPFLAAGNPSGEAAKYISIGFSVKLPDDMALCPPYTTSADPHNRKLTSSPRLSENWQAVWTDQPDNDTAILLRKLPGAATAIRPYDTPLDTVLLDELKQAFAEDANANPFPVVEIPAQNAGRTITLFYSGDGGWRDLDRAVAEQMAARGYPVVGIDTLREFWSTKPPEKAAQELTKMMAYYRRTWNAETFVLAGYSFGADILPAIYNRLSEEDRRSVPLIILLSLGKTADFEIHVAGWIGKNDYGLPILPELSRVPAEKILCIYGTEEKNETACTGLTGSKATVLALPGGHHFDQDYPKLASRLIGFYPKIKLDEKK